ncbi:MAG: Ig-like domain-containing protein [Planctomycetota bacterium]
MNGLSKLLDRECRRHVVRKSAVVALAAGLWVLAAGCEQSGEAGGPTAAPVADRAGAPAAAAVVDTAGSQTPPVVSAPQSPLRVVFDPPALDFGIIPPGVDMTGTIAIRNLGRDPVKIIQMKPTCKCTTLNDLVGTVIEPGGEVELTTELKGRAIAGGRKAAVRFIFEGYQDFLSVDIRAEVALPVRASPAIFNLASGATSGHVVVASLDGRPFNILGANRTPPRYVEFDPDIDEPRSSYVIEWDLAQELEARKLPHWWVIETDHPDCPLVDSWVRHPLTIERPPRERKWRVAERRILLGVTEPGQAAEFTVEITDIGTGAIHSVRSLSPELEAELLDFKRTKTVGSCTVRITPTAGHQGVFQGPVEFMGSTYTHAIDVVGKVAP